MEKINMETRRKNVIIFLVLVCANLSNSCINKIINIFIAKALIILTMLNIASKDADILVKIFIKKDIEAIKKIIR